MKVAVVHDDFIQEGGAEKLVLCMLEVWPQADLFATVVSSRWREKLRQLGFGYRIKNQKAKIRGTAQNPKTLYTSWLDSLPLKERYLPYYYSLYPLAVESFNFDGYDLVVSSSARYAHGVITKPSTVHIAYINSPARFLWEEESIPKNPLLRPVIRWQRTWDSVAGQRPDYTIANSLTPAERIRRYWKRQADKIIYPFVDLERFESGCRNSQEQEGGGNSYFLIVSRLKKWKKIEIAIEACNELNYPLVVVGRGEDERRLKSMAGPMIKFHTDVNDETLIKLYQNCRALIMTQSEDFGITALEAMAAGRPVVAFGGGGALETVLDGVTGIFFNEQTPGNLKETLLRFDRLEFLRQNCIAQAKNFGREKFKSNLWAFTKECLTKNLRG